MNEKNEEKQQQGMNVITGQPSLNE